MNAGTALEEMFLGTSCTTYHGLASHSGTFFKNQCLMIADHIAKVTVMILVLIELFEVVVAAKTSHNLRS